MKTATACTTGGYCGKRRLGEPFTAVEPTQADARSCSGGGFLPNSGRSHPASGSPRSHTRMLDLLETQDLLASFRNSMRPRQINSEMRVAGARPDDTEWRVRATGENSLRRGLADIQRANSLINFLRLALPVGLPLRLPRQQFLNRTRLVCLDVMIENPPIPLSQTVHPLC